MNLGRETILASLVGFAVGLLAAWAVWRIPQLPSSQPLPSPPKEEVAPKAEEAIPTSEFSLELTQPEEGAILSSKVATVAGKTKAGATVVVSGPLKDEVFEATGDGTFSVSLDLTEGANEIVVTAYSQEGLEKTETRTVASTSEEF